MRGAHTLGSDQPGIPQNPKVMRHARLGPTTVELAAGCFGDVAKAAHDVQTYRIAQGVKQSLEDKVAGRGVFEWSHKANHTQGFTNQP